MSADFGPAGKVGALPLRAWASAAEWLVSPSWGKGRERRAALRALRAAHPALARVVGARCRGALARVDCSTARARARLAEGSTAGLGRALVVEAVLQYVPTTEDQLAVIATALEAVRRGHVVEFTASMQERCDPEVARAAEAMLAEASCEEQLVEADFVKGSASGFLVDAMARLSTAALEDPACSQVAEMVSAGCLTRLCVIGARWASTTVLRGLREIRLTYCEDFVDLTPLAQVPVLVLFGCSGVTALPAMRNTVLELSSCARLVDVSGLADGRVGRLKLAHAPALEDVSAIGAMQPRPRTVVLRDLPKVQDVSMLAGVRRLEVDKCSGLNKTETAAALEGTVGTVKWQ